MNSISIEDLIEDLVCSKSKTDDEKINDDDKAMFSDYEIDIINGPEDEDNGADIEYISEECYRLQSEVNTINYGIRVAEEYLWSKQSTESVSSKVHEVGKKVLESFWKWFKGALEKIRQFIILFMKRIQIWIAGDFNKLKKWAIDNKSKIETGIHKFVYEISLNVKKPIGKYEVDLSILDTVENWISDLKASRLFISAQGKYGTEQSVKLGKYIAKNNIQNVENAIYGENAEKKAVSIEEYNKSINIVDTLVNIGQYKTDINKSIKSIKSVNHILSFANSITMEVKAVLPNHFTYIRLVGGKASRAIALCSNLMYTKLYTMVSITKVSYRYAKLAVEKVDAEEAKPKTSVKLLA